MKLGVTGCKTEMPPNWMTEVLENAGNMVHAAAPFAIFGNLAHSPSDARRLGYSNFTEFVNKECTHVIITLANMLRVNKLDDKAHYARFHSQLKNFKKPVIIFGLGAQAQSDEDTAELPQEAINLLKYLGDSCRSIGVRGSYTQTIIRELSGVTNTHVIGCPSLFSRPGFEISLLKRLQKPIGRPAYAGTHFHSASEKALLDSAVQADAFLVEPFNKLLYSYYSELLRGTDDLDVPYFLKSIPVDLPAYCQRRLQFFRTLPEWFHFNREFVRFTYGTRFHVNMASLLSGVPALWITHDSRTKELCEFLHLPNISIKDAENITPDDVPSLLEYGPLLDNICNLRLNFRAFLESHDLNPPDWLNA